jgi:predicted dehydrogenase
VSQRRQGNQGNGLRVALVGKRAGSLMAGIQSLPGCTVSAVCEPNAVAREALGERAGVPESGRFGSYDDVLARGRPDVVVLGTPMPLHVPQAARALAAGVHVLSEVTAAVNIEQCLDLLRAVRDARGGAQYMMAENSCYRKDVMVVRAMAQAGLFGDVYFAEGEYLHDVKELHHNADGSPTWRAAWQVGKRGCTYGTHSLGPALEFFGPQARVTRVSCEGSGMHTDPEHPHDDTVLMVCHVERTPGDAQGALIKVRLDMMSNRPHAMAYYALQGTRGCYEGARVPGEPNHVWLGGEQASDPRVKREWARLDDYETYVPEPWRSGGEAAARAGHGGGDYFVAQEFLAAVLAGRRPPIDVYRALDYTLPGLVSERSIAQGGVPLAVPDPRSLLEREGTVGGVKRAETAKASVALS